MKKLAVIKSENTEIIEAIQSYFKDKPVEVTVYDNPEDVQCANITVLTGFSRNRMPVKSLETVLGIHPSLLPSFDSSNALEEAYTSGVKVTGVTIYRAEEADYGKIIAQYPVLIGLTATFCDISEEIKTVAKRLYPVVINSVLNDTVFDFQQLFNTGCSSCRNSGCSGCKK